MRARKRFLWPREHGAWAQMAMPLATGLALARPGAAAWLLALSAALAFLAHEPALVLLGSRGRKTRADDGPLAWRLLVLLGGAALAAGAGGVVLAPGILPALALPAALGAATLWLARRRLEMTTFGEVLVGAAMASAALPVGLAAGAAPRAAWSATLAWTLSFAIAALAVEAVMARGRPGAADLGRRNALLATAVWCLGFVPRLAGLPWAVPLSLVPTAAFAIGVCLSSTGPQQLRHLGWALVGSTGATLLVLVAGLRAA